jgi:hypothetical protein
MTWARLMKGEARMWPNDASSNTIPMAYDDLNHLVYLRRWKAAHRSYSLRRGRSETDGYQVTIYPTAGIYPS